MQGGEGRCLEALVFRELRVWWLKASDSGIKCRAALPQNLLPVNCNERLLKVPRPQKSGHNCRYGLVASLIVVHKTGHAQKLPTRQCPQSLKLCALDPTPKSILKFSPRMQKPNPKCSVGLGQGHEIQTGMPPVLQVGVGIYEPTVFLAFRDLGRLGSGFWLVKPHYL